MEQRPEQKHPFYLEERATTEFELFGWQIEFGVSGNLLSVGAETTRLIPPIQPDMLSCSLPQLLVR